MEKVQRRATKLLQNISHLSYPERLAALILPTLAYRRIRGDMIETFKIFHMAEECRNTAQAVLYFCLSKIKFNHYLVLSLIHFLPSYIFLTLNFNQFFSILL